jgi:hypothetical protein
MLRRGVTSEGENRKFLAVKHLQRWLLRAFRVLWVLDSAISDETAPRVLRHVHPPIVSCFPGRPVHGRTARSSASVLTPETLVCRRTEAHLSLWHSAAIKADPCGGPVPLDLEAIRERM